MNNENIIQLAINTIRALSIDAVQQANSGHPGTPMALAPVSCPVLGNAATLLVPDGVFVQRTRREIAVDLTDSEFMVVKIESIHISCLVRLVAV